MGARTEAKGGNGFGANPSKATATALGDSPTPTATGLSDSGATEKPDGLSGQRVLSADAFVGRVLSHYRLEERLGAGGMGLLYRATDLKLGRTVAIKLLARHLVTDESAKARFVREARAASALDHPNIATVYEIGEAEGELLIAMALYEGQTLKQRLEKGRLAVDEALGILRKVLLGLEAAHGAGIVHRDIKPANILVTSKGTVKILDFGLAKLISDAQAETMTQAGQAMGTILYMSPEQLRGEAVDSRSDLWSLGVVAYELLAGTSPFQTASSAATVARILHEGPPSLACVPGIPDKLAELVSQLLRKKASQRPQSASEVLRRLNDSPQVASARIKALTAFPKMGRRTYRPLVVALAILALGAAGSYLFGRQVAPRNKINSLVVLPFSNANGDAEAEYLSDGITEGLINSLSQIPELRVIARTTAFRYKGKEVDLQKLRSDLSVEAALTGRVQQRADSVIIQADLVKIDTGSQLWGERYERTLANVSGVQQEITQSISEKLRPRLNAREKNRISKRETANPEAYRLYLRGRYLFNKRTREGLEKALDYYRQAIELDPQYAVAFAGLSSAYERLAYLQHWSPQDAFPKAEAAALKAIALDEELAEPHVSLGSIEWQKWNWAKAETELKRAIALNPGDATARNQYGLYLDSLRHDNEALAQYTVAQKLDPASPFPIANAASLLCQMGRYDRGIASLKDALELDPNHVAHWEAVLACYAPQGRYSEAVEEARQAVTLPSASPIYLGRLGAVSARAGHKTEAIAVLEKLKQADEKADAAVSIAGVYLALGDNDSAIEWLEKAFQRHSNWLIWVKQMQDFEPLRQDPRFANLLRRMRFPE